MMLDHMNTRRVEVLSNMTTVLDMRPYQAQYSISTMHLQQSLASSPESVNQTSTSLTLAEMQAELDEMNRLYTHTITHHHPDCKFCGTSMTVNERTDAHVRCYNEYYISCATAWTIYQTLTDRFLSWLGGRPSQREVIMGQIKQGEAAILDATLAVQVRMMSMDIIPSMRTMLMNPFFLYAQMISRLTQTSP